jgi:uncharacterized protein (TIGR03663 family)
MPALEPTARRRERWEIPAWCLLLAVSFALRFHGLGDRPLHHDESLFSYYAWRIADAGDHVYQPILHGPLFLYLSALVFNVAGDSVASARFWPAFLGALMPLAALFFRREWRPSTCLYVGAAFALSPILLFYERFNRHDIPLEALILLQIAAARWWWRRPPGSNLAGFFVGLLWLLPLGVMENFLIAEFTFFAFLHAWLLADLLAAPKGAGIGRLFERPFLPRAVVAANLGGALALACYFVARLFLPAELTSPSSNATRAAVALAAIDFAAVGLVWARWRRGRPAIGRDEVFAGLYRRFAASWPGLLAGAGVAVLVHIAIFTNFLQHPEPPHETFRRTFEYWLGQHKEHRLKGPFHYYLSILATYQLPALLLCFGMLAARWATPTKRYLHLGAFALLFAAGLWWYDAKILGDDFDSRLASVAWLDAKLHMTSLLHVWLGFLFMAGGFAYAVLLLTGGRALHAFSAFWSCWSLFFYGYAGEKVPWLAMHSAVPIFLWCGCEAEAILRRLDGRRWAKIAFGALLSLQLAWMGFNAVRACFGDSAHPRERLVFNHTTPHFLGAVKTAEAIILARREAGERGMVHHEGASDWPLFFYFRHLANDPPRDPASQDPPPPPSQARAWPREQWADAEMIILDNDWTTDPATGTAVDSRTGFHETHRWFDVPFRRYWQPRLLWEENVPDPDAPAPAPSPIELSTPVDDHEDATLPPLDLEPPEIALVPAWKLAARYYFLREPFFDPRQPHGVWCCGETSHTVPIGIRRDLLEGPLDPNDKAAAAARDFVAKLEAGYWD